MKRLRFIFCFCLLGVLFGGMFSCGGTQKSRLASCKQEYEQLIGTEDEDICSQTLANQFENRVAQWRSGCDKYLQNQPKYQLAKKIGTALLCSREKRRLEILSEDCTQRLEKIATNGSCLGKDCVPFLDEINTIGEDCSDLGLNGVYTEKAMDELRRFNERIKKKRRLRALSKLMLWCDDVLYMVDRGKANNAFNLILKRISKSKKIKKIPEAGSEVERFRNGALESCGIALRTVVETLTEATSRKLSSNRKKRFKRLQKLNRRLKKIDAETLFPGSTQALENALQQFETTY